MPAELSRDETGHRDAGSDASAALEFRGVGKSFGEIIAVQDIDLSVPRHSRIGIVGPSGGGKSTLLQIIAGLMEPDTGEVHVDGASSAPADAPRASSLDQPRLRLLTYLESDA